MGRKPIEKRGISLTCPITYDVSENQPVISGVASTYLANQPAGSRLRCTVRSTKAKFRLSNNPMTPVIIVVSGTGIAPMHVHT